MQQTMSSVNIEIKSNGTPDLHTYTPNALRERSRVFFALSLTL